MNISVENPILQNEIIKKSGNKTKRVRNVATRTNLDVKPARGKIEQSTKAVRSTSYKTNFTDIISVKAEIWDPHENNTSC